MFLPGSSAQSSFLSRERSILRLSRLEYIAAYTQMTTLNATGWLSGGDTGIDPSGFQLPFCFSLETHKRVYARKAAGKRSSGEPRHRRPVQLETGKPHAHTSNCRPGITGNRVKLGKKALSRRIIGARHLRRRNSR